VSAPADVSLSTLRGARIAAVVLQLPATVLLILNTGTSKLGNIHANAALLPVAVLLLGLHGYLVLAALRRRTPPYGRVVWLAVVVCVVVLIAGAGVGDLAATWFVAAAAAFAFPWRTAVVVLVATVVGFVVLALAAEPVCQCWDVSSAKSFSLADVTYNLAAVVPGAVGPFLAVGLLGVVDDLVRTEAQLELTAADEERRRLSRDLHDALGQGLSAVALKGDLALALLGKDRAGAQREIESLAEVARRLRAELPDIVVAEESAPYAVEAARAEGLLRQAGVDVRRQGDLGPVPHPVDVALGWVVREAATNVLRHSDARLWTVRAGHGDREVWLEATNDRPLSATGAAGTGLLGMSERLRAVGGRVRTQADAQRFTLRIEVAR
jgi:two-component system sensor histidine kinase DesK